MSMKKRSLELEHFKTMEELRAQIQNCGGKHRQQAVFSTFHDALTQVCYGCRKVRTTL